MLALRRVLYPDESQYGLETSVVDVSARIDRPLFDGLDHSREHFATTGFGDGPSLRPVAGHVCQHPGGIVADLNRAKKKLCLCIKHRFTYLASSYLNAIAVGVEK